MTKAIYAGTFDPITYGHLDIIRRSMSFCKELIVLVGINPFKKTTFTEAERVNLITKSLEEEVKANRIDFLTATNIKVDTSNKLTVDYAKEIGASVFIRGIRSVSDFEYEINLASVNKMLAPQVETVFLPTSPQLAVVSSTMVKEIVKFNRSVGDFASFAVCSALYEKFLNTEK